MLLIKKVFSSISNKQSTKYKLTVKVNTLHSAEPANADKAARAGVKGNYLNEKKAHI